MYTNRFNFYKIFSHLAKKGFFKQMDDEKYLKLMYKAMLNENLNLENPKTFNEKLNWLKLYDRKPIYTTMVDKYAAKEYVSSIIGKEYIISTIGIYDSFEEIDFDKLPNQFVMKCTHDSGGLVICKDKSTLDIIKAKEKIKNSLKREYYYLWREWPYKNVKPRIIIEKYMVDESGYELKDYKFFCFNGKVRYMKVDFDRSSKHRANYYDTNFVLQRFGEQICPPNFKKELKKPKNFEKMIKLAEILSENIAFLRVDFYDINGKIYFGELTFYPAAGFGQFIPKEWDKKLGDMLELPKEKITDEK